MKVLIENRSPHREGNVPVAELKKAFASEGARTFLKNVASAALVSGATLACAVLSARAAGDDIPLCQLRFSAGQTAPAFRPATLAALDRHPGTFDEVWFSTGVTYPPDGDVVAARRRAAEPRHCARRDGRLRGPAGGCALERGPAAALSRRVGFWGWTSR